VTYKTFMVHTEPGRSNANLLLATADFAERFDASVMGVALCQPMRIVYSEGYVPGELIQQDREQREKELAEAEAEFNDALRTRVRSLDWRSAVTDEPLSDYLAREARGADLLITGVDKNVSVFDRSRHLNIGDLVMQAGRPVLVVPATVARFRFDRVLVGWKDTRETRRAITDALPILEKADDVRIVEIAAPDDLDMVRERLADVVAWLGRHGVTAESTALASIGDDAHRLQSFVEEHKADLIVAGAYGHSRVREWVLGGVTRDLLLRAECCALVSH
jgi:nucleotide-binding universal stress UspA family protein